MRKKLPNMRCPFGGIMKKDKDKNSQIFEIV